MLQLVKVLHLHSPATGSPNKAHELDVCVTHFLHLQHECSLSLNMSDLTSQDPSHAA